MLISNVRKPEDVFKDLESNIEKLNLAPNDIILFKSESFDDAKDFASVLYQAKYTNIVVHVTPDLSIEKLPINSPNDIILFKTDKVDEENLKIVRDRIYNFSKMLSESNLKNIIVHITPEFSIEQLPVERAKEILAKIIAAEEKK